MTNRFRSRFPIFEKHPDLIYLDNAATLQRPDSVIESMDDFYRNGNTNIHRGVYDLSNVASAKYEETRAQLGEFLGGKAKNIAFTSGTTESINMVARSFLSGRLQASDNVVVSVMEHHSNFIPWQQLAKEKGAELRVVPVDAQGNLDLEVLENLLDSKTKMLAVTHVSNTIGTVNDLEKIIEMAHHKSVPVLVDAAQSAALYELDHGRIPFDFLALSAHKMFGPFGLGALFVSDRFRDDILPYNFGGGIIQEVTVGETTFKSFPFNLESGSPNVGAVIGLSAALDFLNKMDRDEVREHAHDLGEYTRGQLKAIERVRVIGSPNHRTGIVSFVTENIHPHDVASFLGKDGIAVRAGMHCTQPLLQQLGVSGTVRASFSIYNTRKEVDKLVESVKELIKFWS